MEYEIKKGDTLIGIAIKNKINIGDIVRANPGLDPRNIPVGTKIKVPKKSIAPQIQEQVAVKKNETKKVVDNRPTEPMPFDEFAALLETIELDFSLPAGILGAIGFVESSGNPFAKNTKTGAKGIFQFMDSFVEEEGVESSDLARAPRAVAAFLSHSYNRINAEPNVAKYPFNGWNREWELVLMSYYAGLTNVLRWMKAGFPPEGKGTLKQASIEYPKKVAAIMQTWGTNSAEMLRPGWTKAFKSK